jgi:uncharacterized protein YndB with AHSA1/START domain
MDKRIQAPRPGVYRALIDASAVARWMVPDGMTSLVHTFDAKEGGVFRISLTYDAADAEGKSGGHTDTYHGRFVKLVPDREVVQTMEFESSDPAMRGEMTVRFVLSDAADGGTTVSAVHENVPQGVPPADNELGWKMSLEKLTAWVEHGA